MAFESSFNFKKSRDELAEKINAEPDKKKRAKILSAAKKTPEYQISKRLRDLEKASGERITPIEQLETLSPEMVDIRSIIPHELKLEIDYFRTTFYKGFSYEEFHEKGFNDKNKLGRNAVKEGVALYKDLVNKLSLNRFHDGFVLNHIMDRTRYGRVTTLDKETLESQVGPELWISIGDNAFTNAHGLLNPFMLIGVENPIFRTSCLIKFWRLNTKEGRLYDFPIESKQSLEQFIDDYQRNGILALDKIYTSDKPSSAQTIDEEISNLEKLRGKLEPLIKEGYFETHSNIFEGHVVSDTAIQDIDARLVELKTSKDAVIFDKGVSRYSDTIDRRAINDALYALLSNKKMVQKGGKGTHALLGGIKLSQDFFDILELKQGKIVRRMATWEDIVETSVDVAGGTAWYATHDLAEKAKKSNGL